MQPQMRRIWKSMKIVSHLLLNCAGEQLTLVPLFAHQGLHYFPETLLSNFTPSREISFCVLSIFIIIIGFRVQFVHKFRENGLYQSLSLHVVRCRLFHNCLDTSWVHLVVFKNWKTTSISRILFRLRFSFVEYSIFWADDVCRFTHLGSLNLLFKFISI